MEKALQSIETEYAGQIESRDDEIRMLQNRIKELSRGLKMLTDESQLIHLEIGHPRFESFYQTVGRACMINELNGGTD